MMRGLLRRDMRWVEMCVGVVGLRNTAADHAEAERWNKKQTRSLKEDLWDWASSWAEAAARRAAVGVAAGHMPRRAAMVATAVRTRRTWVEAGPRRAKPCAQAQRPESGPTRA